MCRTSRVTHSPLSSSSSPLFFYRSSNLPTISIREKIVDYRPLATEGNGKITRFAQRIINFLNNACQIFTITIRSIFYFKRWKKEKENFLSKSIKFDRNFFVSPFLFFFLSPRSRIPNKPSSVSNSSYSIFPFFFSSKVFA